MNKPRKDMSCFTCRAALDKTHPRCRYCKLLLHDLADLERGYCTSCEEEELRAQGKTHCVACDTLLKIEAHLNLKHYLAHGNYCKMCDKRADRIGKKHAREDPEGVRSALARLLSNLKNREVPRV